MSLTIKLHCADTSAPLAIKLLDPSEGLALADLFLWEDLKTGGYAMPGTMHDLQEAIDGVKVPAMLLLAARYHIAPRSMWTVLEGLAKVVRSGLRVRHRVPTPEPPVIVEQALPEAQPRANPEPKAQLVPGRVISTRKARCKRTVSA